MARCRAREAVGWRANRAVGHGRRALRRPGHSQRSQEELCSRIQRCDLQRTRLRSSVPPLRGGAVCSWRFRNAPFPGPPPPRDAPSFDPASWAKLWFAGSRCCSPKAKADGDGSIGSRDSLQLDWRNYCRRTPKGEKQVLSNFLGRASVIHCKMRMFAFSLTTVKLFRHGNCFSGHRSHS